MFFQVNILFPNSRRQKVVEDDTEKIVVFKGEKNSLPELACMFEKPHAIHNFFIRKLEIKDCLSDVLEEMLCIFHLLQRKILL